jgi:hypothetical protein
MIWPTPFFLEKERKKYFFERQGGRKRGLRETKKERE